MDEIRDMFKLRSILHMDTILVGDPLLEDLETDLMYLEHDLKNAVFDNTPKSIKVFDAPDGWYIIDDCICPYHNMIKSGDTIFIKNGTVYMEDHKRFEWETDREGYCVSGNFIILLG